MSPSDAVGRAARSALLDRINNWLTYFGDEHHFQHVKDAAALLRECEAELVPEAAGDRPSLQIDEDLRTLLFVHGDCPAPTRVAAFLRLYAGRIRKNERWDIPETMAAAYESAALELDRFMAVWGTGL